MVRKQLRISIGYKIYYETPLRLMLLGMMLIIFAEPLNIGSIMSLGTYTILIACFVAFALFFRKKRYTLSFLQVILMMIAVLLSLTFSGLTYRELVSAICFMELPLFMVAYDTVNQESTCKAVYFCYDSLSIYYIILSFSSLSHIYYTEYGARQMSFLTLGYNNPNQTGMLLFVCLIILICQLIQVKKIAAKILLGIDIVYMFVLIYMTMSRTALLLSIVAIILMVIYHNKKLPRWLLVCAFVTPLVYTLVSIFGEDLLSNWIILGESIETGRAVIYNHVFEQMTLFKFFVGDFSYKFQNLHNVYMSVFATTGILGLVTFIAFMCSKYKYIFLTVNKTNNKNVPAIGMIAIMIYSSVEAAYFTTGSAYAASVLSIYILCVFLESW